MHRHGLRERSPARIGLEHWAGFIGFAEGDGRDQFVVTVHPEELANGGARREITPCGTSGVELLNEGGAQVLECLATDEVDIPGLGIGVGGGRLGVDKHLLNHVGRDGSGKKARGEWRERINSEISWPAPECNPN